MELLGHGDPADDRPALEDERPEARLREQARGDEAVAPAADDDDVRRGRGALTRAASSCPPRRTPAAFLPGAPMIPPPGMRRRAAHVEAADRRAVLRPARRRPQEEELLERELALEDVALRQPEHALDVERRQHLPVQDPLADVRRVDGDRVDDGVAERLALVVPVALLQVVRARTARSRT